MNNATQIDVRVELITVSELPAFAARMQAATPAGEHLPITAVRALSQSRNPNASAGDVALVTAFADSKCVGYLGLMPGVLQRKMQRRKINWMTSFRVSPELRGQGVGRRILTAARSLGTDMVGLGATEVASRLYVASKSKVMGPLRYAIVDMAALAAARRRPRFSGLIAALNLPSRSGTHLCGDTEPVPHDRETSPPAGTFFVRDERTVRWMLSNPWIVERRGLAAEFAHRYHFSHVRDGFAYKVFRTNRRGSDDGFVVSVSFAKGVRVVKLLDFNWADRATLCEAVLKVAEAEMAHKLHLPMELGDLLSGDFEADQPVIEKKDLDYHVFADEPGSQFLREKVEFAPRLVNSDLGFY